VVLAVEEVEYDGGLWLCMAAPFQRPSRPSSGWWRS